jgi:hypothetical protein
MTDKSLLEIGQESARRVPRENSAYSMKGERKSQKAGNEMHASQRWSSFLKAASTWQHAGPQIKQASLAARRNPSATRRRTFSPF